MLVIWKMSSSNPRDVPVFFILLIFPLLSLLPSTSNGATPALPASQTKNYQQKFSRQQNNDNDESNKIFSVNIDDDSRINENTNANNNINNHVNSNKDTNANYDDDNNNNNNSSKWKKEDLPLLLSPYLQTDQAAKARELSQVPSDVMGVSHAGWLTVDKVKGHHLFFWYFPSQNNSDVPLLVWLNGGPGVSSIVGVFFSNGPPSNQSWVGPFSMLYIDQPVGTGYSFSESGESTYPESQEDYTEELYIFINQFYSMFPELYERDLYIGGQSYAGKFVPAIGYRIHSDILRGNSRLPLTGFYIGGPYFDPQTMLENFFQLPYFLGVLSYSDMARHKAKARALYQRYLDTGLRNETYKSIEGILFPPQVIRGIHNLYNFVDALDTKWQYSVVDEEMTSEVMRKHLRVGTSLKYRAINLHYIRDKFLDSFRGTKQELAVLMDNYKVLLFNGDYDVVVSAVMTEEAILSTPWSRQAEYNASRRRIWRESGGELYGFYTKVGTFCRVVVHGAGHQTAYDQPKRSLRMMTDFVSHGCVDKPNPDHFNPPHSSSPRPLSSSLLTILLLLSYLLFHFEQDVVN